ncbi:MAG: hypothetical protein EOP05_03300 [Proteobacteria bacterium]|nr:MAG: hypothetical protein EOP05_03300 [Pseudomonadota bacterium]
MFGHTYQQISDSYNALGVMLESGVDLINLLSFQEKSGADRPMASRLLARVRSGAHLHTALRVEKFSGLEVSLIQAGEETGELAVVFKQLSQYYWERSAIDRNLKAALFKPLFLFSVALICVSLPPFVLGYISFPKFVFLTAVPIAVVIGLIATLFDLVWRATRNPGLDRWLDKKFNQLPLGQTLSGPIAEERFFVAFHICIKAGASLHTLFRTLDAVSQHPRLEGATRFLKSDAEAKGLAIALEKSGIFAPDQIAGIRTGESTGRLEQQLQIIVKEQRGQVEYRLKLFKEWAPRILYGAIGFFVALNMILIAVRK